MAKTKISEFSSTPSNNTDIDSINIAEGCVPSGINDAIRELMAQLKDWQSGTSNDPYVVGSSGSLTLNQGTANGIPYLNGSKVVTSGSALTFDGTTFKVNGSGQLMAVESTGDYSSSGSGFIRFKDSTGNRGYFGFGGTSNLMTVSNTVSSAAINFELTGSEKMRLTSTGLGLGTGSPTRQLHLYAATPEILLENSAANDWIIKNYQGKFLLNDATAGLDRLILDSSGNLGLGVTPSAWGASSTALQNRNASFWATGSAAYMGYNYFYDGSVRKYIASSFATEYTQLNGTHIWNNAPSGTAGATATFTQAMTLDASGRLLIGATSSRTNNLSSASFLQLEAVNSSATGALVRNSADTSGAGLILGKSRGTSVGSVTAVASGDRLGTLSFSGTDGTSMLSAATIISEVDGTPGTNDMPGRLVFSTTADGASSPTERARIDSSGNLQMQTGAVMPYAPAPASISTTATLTNANIQGQIINTTGTSYTVTMPLGTTLETLASWATTSVAYDFYVINTASGTITMAVNTGVTSLGGLTIATGVSAQFRIRRTAANTFVLYRLG